MEGDGAFARDIPGVESVNEFNNYIELKLADGADTQLILKQLSEKVRISRFEIVEPSLYNIFIDVAKVDPSELKESGVNDG